MQNVWHMALWKRKRGTEPQRSSDYGGANGPHRRGSALHRGGEPYAYRDLEDAAKIFIDQGLNLRILTNGIPEGNGRNVVEGRKYLDRIDRTIDNGVKNFSISLDSMYPARFDYICESEGSWQAAVNTITHIGQRLHQVKGALPTINCVVSNLNLEELPDDLAATPGSSPIS